MKTGKRAFSAIAEWLENFAQKPNALWILFGVSFVEASILPISVDVALIALGVVAPNKGLRLGLIATVGSFLGGYLGYYIGFSLFDVIGKPLLDLYGISGSVEHLLSMYRQHGIGALIVSGFTPLPYISFTYAAGFNHTLDLWTLTIGALIGRTLRFYPIGVLLYLVGSKTKIYVKKYFPFVSIAMVVIFIAGYFLFKRIQ